MKIVKCIFTILFLGVVLSVSSQSLVDAGPDQTIYCSGSVQLNARTTKGWELLQTSPSVSTYMSVYFTSEQNGFIVGANGNISHTTDGGTTWTNLVLDPIQTYYCVYFTSATTGYIGGTSGVLLKTIDGGTTWNSVTTGITAAIRSIYFTSAMVGYATGTGGTIIKTTDGGTSWTKLTSGIASTLYSICFSTQTTGFASGISGLILKTTDAGATWTQQTVGTGVLYSTNFVNTNTGFSVGNAGTILKTTDCGANWIKYIADTIFTKYETGEVNRTKGKLLKSCIFLGSSFINETIGYAVGSSGAVGVFLKTTDGGNSWYEVPSQNSTKMQGVCMVNDKIAYAVGSNGKVMKYDGNKSVTYQYKWYPADGLSNPSIANPVASPTSSTTYLLSVSDGSNVYSDSVNISVSNITTTNAPYAYIGCEGSVKLDSIKPIYKGTEKLSYKWTPSIGLSSDTVPNPIATVTSETTYYLTVSTSTCTGYGAVTVVVQPLTVIPSVDKIIIGNGSAKLNVKTNYSGTSPLHYKWTPSTGLSNDTIPNPIVSITSQTVYSVSVTSRTGCSASGMITVKVSPLTANAGTDKTIQCGGSTQLIATSNYNGTGTLRYKWTPATGLSNDTIETPTATLNTTTTYKLLVTSPTGNTATDQVIVNVTPVTVNAGRDTTVVCGGKVPLIGVNTTYLGTGLRYKWTPATGLSNDTIISPFASPVSNTTYTLTVTTPGGCTATDNVLVKVSNLTVNAGADKIGICGAQVQLGAITTNYTGEAVLHFKWIPATGLSNDTIATPLATISATRTYTLTLSTQSGCTASDAVVVSSVQLSKPTISYVGINSNNKNQLIWNNPTPTKDVLFNIYKETNITNSYVKIGSLQSGVAAVSVPLVFVDTASMPDVQSNKYKLTMIDECGNESAVSDYHKTMHLSINKGINTIWNLIWEAYEGYAVSTYNIYRGTNPANIQIIGSLSGGNTQFSDYTAPTGYVYYQIEAVSSTAAGARHMTKSTSDVTYYSSRSNIATNKSGTDGLYNVKDISGHLSVSPNPASGSINLRIYDQGVTDMQLSIYNALGQLVQIQNNVINGQTIDINALGNGLYMLVVKSKSFTGMYKLLIQK